MELTGRLALVTGAGRGIGRAIALALADAGADVIVNDVAEPIARDTVSAVAARGRRAEPCVADVSDYDRIASAIGAATAAAGRPVDILVNNAGVGDFVSFPEITPAKWETMLGTHLTGAFNCCKVVLPGMMERRWGKIVNIGSVAGKRGDFIGNAHYTAAKAGMMGLTRSLAAYAAPHGVNVNALAPGIVDTELTRQMSAEHKATTLARVPIGRFAALEEIAAATCFLVSNSASYVVGETLSVNGGSYMD